MKTELTKAELTALRDLVEAKASEIEGDLEDGSGITDKRVVKWNKLSAKLEAMKAGNDDIPEYGGCVGI